MSDKSQRLAVLLARIPEVGAPLPSSEGRSLLEVGFLSILGRRISESAADKTMAALAAKYPDWNELRVSQIQEFAPLIQTKSPELALLVARDVREFLQEIYQKIHGFNLDVLKGDVSEAARFATQVPFMGSALGHYLLHLACPGELPISPGIVRTLDRLGVAKRSSSLKKAQAGIESMVPEGLRRDFAIRLGYLVEKWCDAKKPTCWECPLVDACPFGKTTLRDWKQSQRRLEIQRGRDEERQVKEVEKERRRATAEEKRRLIAKAKDDTRRARESERVKAKLSKAAKKRAEDPRSRKKSAPKKSVHKKATHNVLKPAKPLKKGK